MTSQDGAFSLQLLPGWPRLAPLHQQAGQQPDNLCGPYWAAMLLRSRGFLVSPEQVASQAGSVLPIGDPASWLPRGATSRQDYSLPLPETPDLAKAGTSVQGLIGAIAHLSGGAYGCIPLQTEWSADRVDQLLHLCQAHPAWELVPLCNLKTDSLWGASLGVSQALEYLQGHPIQPPKADWTVGHFLMVAGTVLGSAQSLIWVADTYPQFGWQGYHLQSAETLAKALNRGDGHGGGVLLCTAAAYQAAVAQAATALGFRWDCWDNGSP